MPMRICANIQYGLCLLAAVLWSARPDHASAGARADQALSAAVDQDALCGDSAGHGFGKLVAAATLSFFGLAPSTKPARIAVIPVSVSSRASALRSPPPQSVFGVNPCPSRSLQEFA